MTRTLVSEGLGAVSLKCGDESCCVFAGGTQCAGRKSSLKSSCQGPVVSCQTGGGKRYQFANAACPHVCLKLPAAAKFVRISPCGSNINV